MAEAHPINFRADEESNPAPSAPTSCGHVSDRERFMSQPNISQPKTILTNDNEKEYRPRKNKKYDKRASGGPVFGRRYSHKPKHDDIVGSAETISPTTVPQYVPYHPVAEYIGYQTAATAPVSYANPAAHYGSASEDQYRRATTGPFFAPVNFNPGASSHATHAHAATYQSFRTSPAPSSLHHPHKNGSSIHPLANITNFNKMEYSNESSNTAGDPPPKMGTFYPGVPVVNIVPPVTPIRPIDILHAYVESFNAELERLMAAVREPTDFPDAAVNAWKVDIMNRLVTEIIPSLGITTARVGQAVRDGMHANSGSIAVFSGSNYPSHQAQYGAAAPLPHEAPVSQAEQHGLKLAHEGMRHLNSPFDQNGQHPENHKDHGEHFQTAPTGPRGHYHGNDHVHGEKRQLCNHANQGHHHGHNGRNHAQGNH